MVSTSPPPDTNSDKYIGNKFSVCSADSLVTVCYYNSVEHWWENDRFKKHTSSPLQAVWHPNSQVIASGGTDKVLAVFSAYMPNSGSRVNMANPDIE